MGAMTAGIANLTIEQGAGYTATFTYLEPDGVTPVNVGGWTALMMIKPQPLVGNAPQKPYLTVGSGTGEITVGGDDGVFALALTAAQTSLLTNSGVYDILVTPTSGQPIRLVGGAVTVSLAVTT